MLKLESTDDEGDNEIEELVSSQREDEDDENEKEDEDVNMEDKSNGEKMVKEVREQKSTLDKGKDKALSENEEFTDDWDSGFMNDLERNVDEMERQQRMEESQNSD